MAASVFGGSDALSSYTDHYVYVDGVTYVLGRVDSLGNHPIIINVLYGYASGRGSGRACYLTLGSSQTGVFAIGAAGNANGTGYFGSSDMLVMNGGLGRFTITFDGYSYFGRSSAGGTTFDSYGDSWSGSLGGIYGYAESPTAPGLTSVLGTTTTGQLKVDWTTPSANGDTAITGYRVTYANNPSFTSATNVDVGVVNTTTISGLSPGTTYYAKVAARNAVTTAAGSVSVYSSTGSVLLSSGGKVWNGTIWSAGICKVWNGTIWTAGTVKVWNGTIWSSAL